MTSGVGGIDPDRVLVTGHGLFQLSLLREGVADHGIGRDVLRADFDKLAPTGDGFVVVSLFTMAEADEPVSILVVRVEREALAKPDE